MRRYARLLGRERGVTAMELAIIAPLLFLLIMSIVEGGRIFSAWLIITNEAREGARYGVVRYGDPSREPTLVEDVQSRVRTRIGSMMSADPSKLTVAVALNRGDPSVSVGVDYRVDIITPLIQNVVPNPFTVHAMSVMRAE